MNFYQFKQSTENLKKVFNDYPSLAEVGKNVELRPIYEEEDNIYYGEWQNNQKQGRGIILYKNGNKYEGYFMNNKPNKKGRIYFKEGDYYEGEIYNDKIEGK